MRTTTTDRPVTLADVRTARTACEAKAPRDFFHRIRSRAEGVASQNFWKLAQLLRA
jgi:hypothetical protein